jgi:uncharacterized protein YecE (DUF72 family)
VIKVGCCGFPVSQAEYFKTFRLVEVQRTFYDPPRLSTLVKWRRTAPEGFEFTMKAWQLITHEPKSPTYRRLRRAVPAAGDRYGFFRNTDEVFEAWEKTREAASALRTRVILFQCPPSFGPSEENTRNMTRFFSVINRKGLDFAWEPRGTWEDERIAALCRDLDLTHVVDPFQKKQLCGRFVYFRLHGIGGYRYRYSKDELRRLRGLIGSSLHTAHGTSPSSERAVYCLFNNSSMHDNAREFLGLLEEGEDRSLRDPAF